MKLLESLKQYNKLVLKENAKLKSIYESLLKESGEEDEDVKVEETEETADKDAGEKTEESDQTFAEADEMMSAAEFFKDSEDVDEDDILDNRPHNNHLAEGETCPECKKNPCVCEKDSDDNAEESVEEADKSEEEDKVDEEEMMSAEEFFADSEEDEVEESEEDEVDEEEEGEQLEESLIAEYRKRNARLFQD